MKVNFVVIRHLDLTLEEPCIPIFPHMSLYTLKMVIQFYVQIIPSPPSSHFPVAFILPQWGRMSMKISCVHVRYCTGPLLSPSLLVIIDIEDTDDAGGL